MLKIGIVGLPNVGKSTLFNALVKGNQAEASNYPFCTIEPNVGIVEVTDERLNRLAQIVNPAKIVPAAIEFVDIAGLVAGAHKGEGLGNKFLSHIREVDAIALVTRFFENSDITHVSGQIDPKSDIETIMLELVMADFETVSRLYVNAEKQAKDGSKDNIAKKEAVKAIYDDLEQGKPVNEIELPKDLKISDLPPLLTLKPRLYLANISESQISSFSPPFIPSIPFIPISAKLEAELANLPDSDKAEFLATYGLEKSGLEKVIQVAYDILGLQSYFTAGPKEVKAWTVKKGATAPQAAGVIHTDFEKGFIRAEVISYEDYIKYDGEPKAREAGRMRSEGRDYIVHDGDVMLFRFNLAGTPRL